MRRGFFCGSGGGIFGVILFGLVIVYGLPILGGYLLVTGEDDWTKIGGAILLTVGIALWCIIKVS